MVKLHDYSVPEFPARRNCTIIRCLSFRHGGIAKLSVTEFSDKVELHDFLLLEFPDKMELHDYLLPVFPDMAELHDYPLPEFPDRIVLHYIGYLRLLAGIYFLFFTS